MKTRSMRIRMLVLVMAGALCCARPVDHSIAEGTYVSPEGSESVTVDGGTMRFVVKHGRYEGMTLDKACSYFLSEDGRIRAYPMSSVEAVNGVGYWDWYWEQDRIVQVDRNNVRKHFVRRDRGAVTKAAPDPSHPG